MGYMHKVDREDDLTWTVCGLSVDDEPDLRWQRDLDGVSCPWCITRRTAPIVEFRAKVMYR